jgi:hypothetical protein
MFSSTKKSRLLWDDFRDVSKIRGLQFSRHFSGMHSCGGVVGCKPTETLSPGTNRRRESFFLSFITSLSTLRQARSIGRRTSSPSVLLRLASLAVPGFSGRRSQRRLGAWNRPHERPDLIPSPFHEMAYRHGEGNDQACPGPDPGASPTRARIFRRPRIV